MSDPKFLLSSLKNNLIPLGPFLSASTSSGVISFFSFLEKSLNFLFVVGERFPICQDVEDKWQNILTAYMPDGVREYNEYPMVSLGWIMFVGMAMAKYWDLDWEKYADKDDIYETLRKQRGFDEMDEYILEEVLEFDEEKCKKITDIVAE